MTNKRRTVSILLAFIFGVVVNLKAALAVTYQDYENALNGSEKINIEGLSQGDGKGLHAYLYKA